ncbi:MAG: hypothetical protein SNJ78_10505 [Spirochaetales bacterium]
MKSVLRGIFTLLLVSMLSTVGETQGSKAERTPPSFSPSISPSSSSDASFRPTSPPTPALRRVILYTSGTAYYEREAQVTGSGTLEMYFSTRDIDDLLKSLVVLDPAAQIAPSVSYSSQDPIERRLKSYALDISDNPDLPSLLVQARGEEVEIWAGERITGLLLGTETRTEWEENPSEGSTLYVNVLTTQGLQSVAYKKITRLQFLNPRITGDLHQALQYLAENRNTDKKKLTLRYTGSGQRTLRISYVLENPVWKTAFRLLLGEGTKPLLQGWGIVENSTDEDWENVQIDLISGRPISFSMNLFEPLYNPRPRIPYAVEKQMPPPLYSSGVAPSPSEAQAEAPTLKAPGLSSKSRLDLAPEASVLADAWKKDEGEPEGLGGFSQTQAEAQVSGEYIRYSLKGSVSIPRRQAALLPILFNPLEGERVSIFNPSVHPKHPLLGVWLQNTSGYPLMGGPISVYEEGLYAGDARIDTLSVQDKRLISYALDLDTQVLHLDKTQPESITQIRIVQGTLHVSKTLRQERTYTIINRGTKPRLLWVEHPIAEGYKLIEPNTFEERTEQFYRFRLQVPPHPEKSLEFKVVEEKPLETTVAISSLQPEAIGFYLNQRVISARVREALNRLITLRNQLSDARRQRQELEGRLKQITQEQERIRTNMEVLDRTTPLYQRYLKTLNDQEDLLEDLQKKLTQAGTEEQSRRRALEEYLSTLEAE